MQVSLQQQQMRQLDANLLRLTRLVVLDLSHNELESLPASIAQLASLATLRLRDNRLSDVPPELSQLSQLHALDLGQVRGRRASLPRPALPWPTRGRAQNRFDRLPQSLCWLSALDELLLDANRLVTLPHVRRTARAWGEAGSTALGGRPDRCRGRS